jgi:hypothetical protein
MSLRGVTEGKKTSGGTQENLFLERCQENLFLESFWFPPRPSFSALFVKPDVASIRHTLSRRCLTHASLRYMYDYANALNTCIVVNTASRRGHDCTGHQERCVDDGHFALCHSHSFASLAGGVRVA